MQKRPDEPFCALLSALREVFKAKHRLTGQKVALKKVLMENEKEGVSVGWVGRPAISLGHVGFHPTSSTHMLRFNICIAAREFPQSRK